MDASLIDKFIEDLKKHSEDLKNLIVYKDVEKRHVLHFAFAMLADNYINMSAQASAQGSDSEATYFSSKALYVRRMTKKIFGSMPEKDFYTGMYQMQEPAHVSIEELHQFAMLAVQNIAPKQEIMNDKKALVKELERIIGFMPKTATIGSVVNAIREEFVRYKARPDKLGNVYELLLLAFNVEQIFQEIKKSEEEEKKYKKRLESIRRPGGFRFVKNEKKDKK